MEKEKVKMKWSAQARLLDRVLNQMRWRDRWVGAGSGGRGQWKCPDARGLGCRIGRCISSRTHGLRLTSFVSLRLSGQDEERAAERRRRVLGREREVHQVL